ncbi:hypothetical protein [Peribacillus sp. SCS-155]|uniref:hypothetical protein n=1 Tax=Peribacillus sedimenti TaxID=3115297 RepID=UPI003905E86C
MDNKRKETMLERTGRNDVPGGDPFAGVQDARNTKEGTGNMIHENSLSNKSDNVEGSETMHD